MGLSDKALVVLAALALVAAVGAWIAVAVAF
jgi:hypothetical protein